MKNKHMNDGVRTCQGVQLYGSDHDLFLKTRPPGAHLSARLCTNWHLTVDAELSLCTISLPSYSFTSVLPLTLHFGTVCSLREAKGLKHEFCLAHMWGEKRKSQEKTQMECYPQDLKQAHQAYCSSDVLRWFLH